MKASVSVLMEFLNDVRRKELMPIKILFASLMTAVYSLYPYLTLQLRAQGITAAETAIIYSIMPVFTFLAPPVVGFCVDKFGNIKVVYCGFCLLCVIFADSLMFIPNAVVENTYENNITWQLPCSTRQSQLKGSFVDIPTRCNLINANQTFNVNVPVTLTECIQVCTAGDASPVVPCLRDHQNRCQTPNSNHWTLMGMRIDNQNSTLNNIISLFNGSEFLIDNLLVGNNTYDGFGCNSTSAKCWTTCVGKISGLSLCKNIEVYNPMAFWINLVIRILQSISSTSAYVLFEAMTLEVLKKHKADYGHQKIWGHIIACIITPITGLLIDYTSAGKAQSDYSIAFYIYSASRLTSFVIMPFLIVDFKMPEKTHFKDVKTLAKNREFTVFVAIIFMTGAFWGYLEGFIFLFLKELNSPQVVMGLTVTAGAVAGLPMLLCSGLLIDKMGHVNVLALGMFIYTIRFIGYSLIWNPYVCLLFESLEAFTSVLHSVAAVTYVAKLAPPAILASAQGLFVGVHFGIGKGAGSLVGGYLMSYLGSRASFQILSGISGAATIAYLITYHLWIKIDCDSSSTMTDKIKMENITNATPNNQNPPSQAEFDKTSPSLKKLENNCCHSNGGKFNTGFEYDDSNTRKSNL